MKAEIKITHLPKRFLLGLIGGYQYFISPLFPPSCRFVPTCSHYALQAIERHGVLRGGGLHCVAFFVAILSAGEAMTLYNNLSLFPRPTVSDNE